MDGGTPMLELMEGRGLCLSGHLDHSEMGSVSLTDLE